MKFLALKVDIQGYMVVLLGSERMGPLSLTPSTVNLSPRLYQEPAMPTKARERATQAPAPPSGGPKVAGPTWGPAKMTRC
jgi:hypothetical protein